MTLVCVFPFLGLNRIRHEALPFFLAPHFSEVKIPKLTQVTEHLEAVGSSRVPVSTDMCQSITGKLGQDPILDEVQDGSVVCPQALGWKNTGLNPIFNTY